MNYAVICLDETASMRGNEKRVVSSLNEYVSGLPEDTLVTVFKFNSTAWTNLYDGSKSAWRDVTVEDYKPNAMTPLLDSIAKTIEHAKKLTSTEDKVFIMIDTDGEENCSKEETVDSVKALVQRQKEAGWEFWFMANGIDQLDARKVADMGHILAMNVASNTHFDRNRAYGAQVGQTVSYFSGDTTKSK